jgi:hypothetical protein
MTDRVPPWMAKSLKLTLLSLVKGLKALVSGADSDLKEAYEQFQKRVKHEQEVVQKATLSAVELIKVETRAARADVQSTFAATQRLEEGMGSVIHGTERVTRYLDGKSFHIPLYWTIGLLNWKGQERANLLNWLSPLTFRDYQKDVFAKHHAGTGRWLLDSEEFQDWLCGPYPSTLWCPGDRKLRHLMNALYLLTLSYSWCG